MLKIHMVQAEHGDCFILEFSAPSGPGYILIDGGPKDVYGMHLQGELRKIKDTGGDLDLVILSHVDNDHSIGLLDLIAELREEKANGLSGTILINELWHNTFSSTIGDGNDIEPRLKMLLANAGSAGHVMSICGAQVEGIGEGNSIRIGANALGIPINPGFNNNLICVEDASQSRDFGELSLRIIGPTKDNLEDLRVKWLNWLDKYEDAVSSANPFLASMADRSIPNLSSITILAEADGKRALFTGDARGDHIIQGLEHAGLLNSVGDMHVDILKVPHHGSDRNVTKKFFKTITADRYLISANGKYGNPDLATLIWIVEAAKEKERTIDVIVSNKTDSTDHLVNEYDPAEYGYTLLEMASDVDSLTLEVSQ